MVSIVFVVLQLHLNGCKSVRVAFIHTFDCPLTSINTMVESHSDTRKKSSDIVWSGHVTQHKDCPRYLQWWPEEKLTCEDQGLNRLSFARPAHHRLRSTSGGFGKLWWPYAPSPPLTTTTRSQSRGKWLVECIGIVHTILRLPHTSIDTMVEWRWVSRDKWQLSLLVSVAM